MIIGISGKKETGKDLSGEIINKLIITNKNKYYTIYKFADAVKTIVVYILGCTISDMEDRGFKERKLGGEWGDLTPRKFLQLLGTDCARKIHPNIWVNCLLKDYSRLSNWIITDCRFPNEVKAIEERGGFVIRINRNNIETNDHESETALDNYKFKYVVDNNGTKEELTEKLREILIQEGLL